LFECSEKEDEETVASMFAELLDHFEKKGFHPD